MRRRCLVDPAACQWTVDHHREVIVSAAWRQHYADHVRGEQLAAKRPSANLASPAQHNAERGNDNDT